MTKRVLIIGAESSGKTTLARSLAEKLNVPWIPEYGRTFGETTGNVYCYEDMLHIAKTQVSMENTSHPMIICDTSPLVTAFYSLRWYGKADPELVELSKRKYDLIFFCSRDFGYVDDGTRNGVDFGTEQEQFYKKHLNQPYIPIRGSVAERVSVATKFIRC